MSRKTKNSKGKTLAVLSVALLLGAGVTTVGIGSGGFQNWDVQTWFNQNADEPGNIDANIDAHGMKVRKLATVENQDGSVSQIYSYSVTPSGATRKEMTISVAWNGETNAAIADFITAEVDSQAQTFTITKKADFATQAKATIRAVSAQGVYADILIDCKQVFLGFNQNTTLNAVKNVDADHAIGLASIKEALAIQAGGNNVSSTYTIALSGGYTLGNLSFANPNYVMGNALDAIADAGITETNAFSIKAKDLSVDLGLSDIQGLVNGDYAKFGESKVQEIEGKAYFGLSYTMTGTLSREGQSTSVTANITAVAATSLLSFGSTPSAIDPESSHVVFNDDTSSSSQGSDPQEVTYQYFLERAGDSNPNSEVLQTIEMQEHGDSGWFVTDVYDIQYGQAFRVRIHGSDNTDEYSDEDFAWGNTNGGGFFAFNPEGYQWENPTQDLGGGLYYVNL